MMYDEYRGGPFCPKCGARLPAGVAYCPQCGAPVTYPNPGPVPWEGGVSPYNRLAALLLCVLVGALGIHRFYVGKVGTGILWLCTAGVFGIGVLVDLVMICTGGFTDGYGRPVLDWQGWWR